MARFRLFPRYCRPSIRTALGITRAKRRLRRRSGYYAATRWMLHTGVNYCAMPAQRCGRATTWTSGGSWCSTYSQRLRRPKGGDLGLSFLRGSSDRPWSAADIGLAEYDHRLSVPSACALL